MVVLLSSWGARQPALTEGGSPMRRLVVLMSVVALMMVMLAMCVAPAFAIGPPSDLKKGLTCRTVESVQEGHEQARPPLFCQD
jgi:hypothetical protein